VPDPQDIVVREARIEDLDTIVGFACALANETEARELDRGRVVRGVEACLVRDDRGRYIVAEREGEVVAQLMLTDEWSDWRNGRFLWIQSVYVAPHARRGHVYSKMHRHVLELAKNTDDVCGIRLYVHSDNAPALATYFDLGMERTHYELLETDFDDAPAKS